MTRFQIRDARGPDRDEIGRLWRELMTFHHALDPRFTIAPDAQQRYVRHVQEMIRTRDGRVLVATDTATGELVGYLIGELQQRPPIALPGLYGFISDMYVSEAWRREGVGKALFSEMRRWFLDRKATAIELYVAQANPNALAFWQAMGLEPFLTLFHLDLSPKE